MQSYPEITYLQNLCKKYNILVEAKGSRNQKDWIPATITIIGHSYDVLIDDEYKDFDPKNQLMCLFLVLFNLEAYAESQDFSTWCIENGLDIRDVKIQQYYRDLATTYREIEGLIGKIDAGISCFDYQLRTGVIQTLAQMSS